MPLVMVNRNPKKVNNIVLEKLVKSLPRSIAVCLSTNDIGGSLSAGDIGVKAENFGIHDIHTADLEIIVTANLYPGRQKNLDFRREELCKMVEMVVPKEISGFVWIRLVPASFGKLWSQA